MAGRPATPIRAHIANGTYKPSRHAHRGELENAGEGVGDMPEWFSGDAAEEWIRLTTHESYKKNLSMVHRSLLIEYCAMHAQMMACARCEEGAEFTTSASKQLSHLRSALCLTLATESKLPKRGETKTDGWEDL